MTSAPTSARVRGPRWATAMRWVGAVLLVLTVPLGWANRTLLDAEGFADATVEALQQPAVAAEIAEVVTDEIILAAEEDLTAIRPLIVSTVEVALTSDVAAGAIRLAASTAHDVAFSEQGNTLLLNLQDLAVLVKTALRTIAPEAADSISEAEIPVEVPVAGDATDDTVNLAQQASKARWLLWGALVLGTGLLLAGILLARSRRHAMLSAGVGLITGGLLVAVGVVVGRLTAVLATGDNSSLVDALYQSYVGPLLSWGVALALIGVVIAAAAAALLDRMDLDAWLRSAARALARTPASRFWAAVRAVALLAAGILVAWHPTDTVTLLVVLGGVLLAFLGLRELLGMIAGPAPATRGAPTEGPGAVPWRLAMLAVVGVALVGVGVAFLATRTPPVQAAFAGACNGSVDLCDQPFDEVALAGTHNSMASADVPGWLFPNQGSNIPDQLADGIRALLIDTHVGLPTGDAVVTDLDAEPDATETYVEYVGQEGLDAALRIRDRVAGQPTGDPAIYLCHGFCELGAQPMAAVLTSIRSFLVSNPGEVLAIVIQDDGGTPEQISAVFSETGLSDLVWKGDVPTRQGTGEFPTLGEMVEANQRVMVLAENRVAGAPSWYHLMYDTFQETPYKFESPDEMSCAPNRGGTDGSLFLVNNWIETAPAPKPSNATIVNDHDRLLERVQRCQTERSVPANVVAVDFYGNGDVLGVVDTLNGIPDAR